MVVQLRESYRAVVPEPTRARVLDVRRRVRGRLRRATAPVVRNDLSRLAWAYDTSKRGPDHHYIDAYERHLGPRRRERLVVLEIGIGGEHDDPKAGGASLRMWRRWMPRAQIHGADLYDKSGITGRRITVHRTDQSDPAALAELAARVGPSDIVIDDGSHVCEHVITTFHALFPTVRPGGTYVIEDIHTSFLVRYGGRPRGSGREGTAIGFVADLLDGLHMPGDVGDVDPTADEHVAYADRWIGAVHVYPDLAIIEKLSTPRERRPR